MDEKEKKLPSQEHELESDEEEEEEEEEEEIQEQPAHHIPRAAPKSDDKDVIIYKLQEGNK